MKDTSNQSMGHNHSQNVFDNVEMFIEKFDGEDRDTWQKPNEVIASFNLSGDAVVVDLGSGTGYFSVRIAPHLTNGKVICFDQSSQMTAYLTKRATEMGIANIDARMTDQNGNVYLEEKVDLIFSVDVYHHLQHRTQYFSRIAQYLKQGGVVAVIDRTEEKVEGQPIGHRVPKEQIKEEMQKAGFELVNDFDFLLPVQCYLTFKRVY
jgi:cyclopropane fatty-acyl-phospholipid synthase-like methyltransferase